MKISTIMLALVWLVAQATCSLLYTTSVFGADNPPTLTLGFYGPPREAMHGTRVSVPLTYTGPPLKVSSFNLRFAFNDRALLLMDIEWGRVIPNVPTAPTHYQKESLDSTLADGIGATVHLTGLSKIGDTDITVDEMFEFRDGDTLATFTFHVTGDRTYTCVLLNLRWIWMSCRDNKIVTRNANLASQSVIDLKMNEWTLNTLSADITDTLADLPSHGGAPANCSEDGSLSSSALRKLAFRNGGVLMVCNELPSRGDINLNGISYELDDITVLARYITDGKSAFGVDTMGQSFNADCNQDGVVGDLRDFAVLQHGVANDYLVNIYGPDSSYLDTVTLRQIGQTVSFDRELAALLLVFDGQAKVDLIDNALQLTEGQIDGDTYVLVYGHFTDGDKLTLLAPGIILETDGILKRAGAANYDGYKLHTIITH